MTTTLLAPLLGTYTARIQHIRQAAAQVLELELQVLQQEDIALAASAGAHIDVHLPNGVVRQYSLLGPCTNGVYRIGVALSPSSRGGSEYIHQSLSTGQELQVSLPRNNFPLQPCSDTAVLVAGGIGITPIWSMVQELEARAQPWVLYYCARSAEHAAFLTEIQTLAEASRYGTLYTVFDQYPPYQPLNLNALFAVHGLVARYYCCGPAGMLDAFVAAVQQAGVPESRAHIERFAAVAGITQGQEDSGFEVELRDGSVHVVAPDQTILDVLIEAGVGPMYSCKEGICGSCETRVLGGTPDHRDSLLSAAEQASNKTMLICVSRCKEGRLLLDI